MSFKKLQSFSILSCVAFAALTNSCATSKQSAPTAKSTAEQPAATSSLTPSENAKTKGDIDFGMTHNINTPNGQLIVSKAWQVSKFVGTGRVWVEGDSVFIERGHDMTGISWKGPLARMNYEIELDAKRAEGNDFFCGLTFPYGDDPCSLIVGGWGGTCVGISSLDFQDAYNNETARFRDFVMNRWYHIRLRVTPSMIEAWIDDEQIVKVDTTSRGIGIRWEVEPSVPLGISTWQTTGALRNIRFTVIGDPKAARVKKG